MTINDDDRAEAGRLKLLPRSEQRAIIALHMSVADDRDICAENRAAARRRVKVLNRLLNLESGKPKKS